MAKNQTRLPSSTAGITSFTESTSVFKLKPGHVIVFIVIMVLLVIALKVFGPALFGGQ
jgi:preprotein translocase subunit Sec61beta